MRAVAGDLARLTAAALSKAMAKASPAFSPSARSAVVVAAAATAPRPRMLSSSSPRGPEHYRRCRSSSNFTAAAASPASRGERESANEDYSSNPERSSSSFSFVAASERGTALLATLLSSKRKRGDVLLLYGDVGAGKSAFSRAFIRAAAGDDELPVPSPTFLLHNVYDEAVVADRGELFFIFFSFSFSFSFSSFEPHFNRIALSSLFAAAKKIPQVR